MPRWQYPVVNRPYIEITRHHKASRGNFVIEVQYFKKLKAHETEPIKATVDLNIAARGNDLSSLSSPKLTNAITSTNDLANDPEISQANPNEVYKPTSKLNIIIPK